MMNLDLQNIIEEAVLAPSGENCQPWRFSIKDGKEIGVWNIPERDTSLYNVNDYGSLAAHGALIENIVIISASRGLKAIPKIFPSSSKNQLVATITFEEQSNEYRDDLHRYIEKRCTNRRTYSPIEISNTQLSELKGFTSNLSSCSTSFITDKKVIESLSTHLSLNERIVFENSRLHNFFFTHIRWTKEEQEREPSGFFLPTLELDKKQEGAMKIFKHWTILRILNLLGVSKVVANDNARRYASSSLLGTVLIDSLSRASFVDAGRVFQRIWLTITKYGWSLHPLTGVVLLNHALSSDSGRYLNQSHKKMLSGSYKVFQNAFQTNKKEIAILFRVGQGGTPSAHSPRMRPKIEIL